MVGVPCLIASGFGRRSVSESVKRSGVLSLSESVNASGMVSRSESVRLPVAACLVGFCPGVRRAVSVPVRVSGGRRSDLVRLLSYFRRSVSSSAECRAGFDCQLSINQSWISQKQDQK